VQGDVYCPENRRQSLNANTNAVEALLQEVIAEDLVRQTQQLAVA
jgi:hypothetical protein